MITSNCKGLVNLSMSHPQRMKSIIYTILVIKHLIKEDLGARPTKNKNHLNEKVASLEVTNFIYLFLIVNTLG